MFSFWATVSSWSRFTVLPLRFMSKDFFMFLADEWRQGNTKMKTNLGKWKQLEKRGVEMISEWRRRQMIGGTERRNRWSLEGGIGGGAGGSDCLRAAPLISVSLLVNIVCGPSHWMLRWMIDMAITCLLRWLKAVVLSAILNGSHKSTSFCNNI